MTADLDRAHEEYHRATFPAVALAAASAAQEAPVLRERLSSAGLCAEDLAERWPEFPVMSKDDLVAIQRSAPHLGGLLLTTAPVAKVFQSPGPLYEPQLEGPDPWRWSAALRAVGIGDDDLVLNCFGYHLSPAGAMFEEGARAVGARVIPAGIGNQDLQVQAMADLGVTAYIGLPSYLNTLFDRYDQLGLDPDRWRLRSALVTAEPLPDTLRARLTERVPRVLMAYGTAEAGNLGFEDEPGGGLLPAPGCYLEVCDPDGIPVPIGDVGEVVVSLARTHYPLVRFGTGDLSRWCLGRAGSLRLAGVLGRVGSAVKVRGMFLHPQQAAALLDAVDGVERWQFRIERAEHRDDLTCAVVVKPGADVDVVRADVAARIRSGLRFTCAVEVVAALPPDAPGVVDNRTWE